MKRSFWAVALFWIALFSAVSGVGPFALGEACSAPVTLVVGPDASPLEKLAADELADLLRRLFDVEVAPASRLADDRRPAIVLGTEAGNPAIRSLIVSTGAAWPKLSEQGHLVKSLRQADRDLLAVVGGSPVATFWAVSELANQFGVRSLLQGDVLPADRPEFRLTGFDRVLEPQLRRRGWQLLDAGPIGGEAWGLADQRLLVRQLARLKFNQLRLSLGPNQPLVALEYQGVRRQSGELFGGQKFPVTGDTPGRAAFKGAREFTNPDFAAATSYAQRTAAGVATVRGLIETARELGMTVELAVAAEPAPDEFRQVAEDKAAWAAALRRAYSETYPGAQIVDAAARGPAGGPTAGPVELRLSADEACLLPRLPTAAVRASLESLRKQDGGFLVRCDSPGDASPLAYYLSRTAFEPQITADEAYADLIGRVSGEGVAERVIQGFAMIDEASGVIERNDPQFAAGGPNMILKHLTVGPQSPVWWKTVREKYVGAMNEMYRGNTRAREGARRFTLYYAKRCEYALHYMNCVEAVRAAGAAKAQGDADGQVEQLEKAVEALYSSLNALADVARDPSDRGAIAVVDLHGFQPLRKEFEKAEQGE